MAVKQIKKLAGRRFESFAYFYRFLRFRIFIAVGLSIAVGVLDGFGLTMFLPLLQMADEGSNVNPESLGNLRFVLDAIELLGIQFTTVSILLVLVGFFLLKGVAKYFSQLYKVFLQQYFIKKIRMRLLNALNRISFKSFVLSDVGRIQNTMSGEVDRIARAYNNYFGSFQQSVMVVVYMTFAFFVDPEFALLVTLGGSLTNLLYNSIYARTKGSSKKLTRDSHVYQGQIMQHVGNFKYLRATGLVEKFANRLRKTINFMEDSRRKIGHMSAVLMAAREPLMIMVVSVVIIVQVEFMGGSIAPIMISLLFFYRALSALMVMQESWNRYLEVSGSLDNMLEFQKELDGQREDQGTEEFQKFSDRIALHDVSFRYKDEYIINHVNLEIKKNETVAFVGESGSGKTTLINVICGLLKVEEGKLMIDQFDSTTLKLETFQKRVGYITQEPVIFNDTIFNNVTFWDEPNDENRKRFENVLNRAALSAFVSDLKDGADTLLGSNGVNLSGGQRQRISIARELYKDIDILIMDEATSALDSETEKFIQESIDQLHGAYTILIVAHRLSTIKTADRIVFMNRGTVEQVDSYANLLERNTKFKKMVELQEL